jgi:two-component system sensor histidine kinase/response regulator
LFVPLKELSLAMIDLDNSCSTASFDAAGLLERVEGDTELLREIVDLFAADSPRLLDELRQASAEGDAETLKRAAHTLKGAASNFGATAVMDAARDLETMGREGNLAGAAAVCGRLEKSLRVFEDGLAMFVASLPAA